MPQALTLEEKKSRALEAQKQSKQDVPSNTDVAQGRKRRNVFNGTEVKISVRETIPGYHLHCFTDTGNRIQEAQDAGYEFVTPAEVGGVGENVVSRNGDLGDRVRYLVNPRADGSEQYGYLMKQRLEWFEEDQAALAAKNNLIDAAIKKGKVTGGDPSFYVPQGGIKLS